MTGNRLSTPDLVGQLVAALDRVSVEAQATIDKLNEGRAVNGVTGLGKIKHLAADALQDYAEADGR